MVELDWTKTNRGRETVVDGHRIVMTNDSSGISLQIWDLTDTVFAVYIVTPEGFEKDPHRIIRQGIILVGANLAEQLNKKKQEPIKVTVVDPPSRHLRRVLFSVDALVAFLSSIEAHRITANGLPYGTRVVTVNFDRDRQIFDILVEHPNFSITEPGEVIPTLPGVMFEIVRTDAD